MHWQELGLELHVETLSTSTVVEKNGPAMAEQANTNVLYLAGNFMNLCGLPVKDVRYCGDESK